MSPRSPLQNDLFVRACRRQPVERTPVWFMRQAGRYMPEYRALRSRYGLLEICRNPELAMQVSLQPLRLGVDACILFSDILLPLEPMGVPFSFEQGEGPVMHRAIATPADVDALRLIDPEESLGYVPAAIRHTQAELAGRVPLIGFAGAPFTLASYLLEGGRSRQFLKLKRFLYTEPAAWHRLMGLLSEVIRRFLRSQVEAGVDALQLFDSWAGILSPDEYREYVLPHVSYILQDLAKMGCPLLHFGTGTYALLPLQREAGGDVIGLDAQTPLEEGWARVGYDCAVQGNLSPAVLLASPEVAKKHALRILQTVAGRRGHIFNLGHGVLPETPVETVQEVIAFVQRESERIQGACA